MSRYPHVAAAVFDSPWLIMPTAMRAIVEVLDLRLEGGRLSDDEIADRLAVARRDAGPRSAGRRAGAVAVIPIYGVITQRANLMTEMSGATSVEAAQRAFREALADPDVTGILLDVDSPGGSAAGVPEFGEEIRAARGRKPIVAVSNALMASAAYWLGAQADELVVAPSSLTGSVGVVMAHEDWTGFEEKAGIKTTLIYAGENKIETYNTVALTDDARAHMQDLVNDLHGLFLRAVALGRGVSVEAVREGFGKGRVLAPRQAVKIGMADRIGTFDDAIVRLGQGKVKARSVALVRAGGPIPPHDSRAIAPDDAEWDAGETAAISRLAERTTGDEEMDRPPHWEEDTVAAAAEFELAAARARTRRR